MTALARSSSSLQAVRGYPFGWPVSIKTAAGSAQNLTGWTIEAFLFVGQNRREPLTISSRVDASGTFQFSGTSDLLELTTAPQSGSARIVVVASDPAGVPRIYEYPLTVTDL